MNALKRQFAIGCTAMMALPVVGCLERKETITVMRDGGVRMQLRYEGDPKDFEGGDAMPSEATADRVTIQRKVEDDGDEKVILNAEWFLKPGEPLPESYATPSDPDGDLYLNFPTSLTIEHARDGTYYHFARSYTPRKWAHVQYWQDFMMEGDTEKRLEKPVEELTHEDRVSLFEAFAAIEAFKQVELVKEALAECAPDLPQHHKLMAHQKLLHVFRADDMLSDAPSLDLFGDGDYLEALIARCDALPNGERDACYEAEAEDVLSQSYEALVQSLRTDAGFTASDVAVFDRAYDRAKRRYEITDLLGGHHFEVCVKMPGRIIAHNAEDSDDPNVGNGDATEICWSMEGKAVRDRQVDMMVTSFVPATRGGK